MRTTRYILFLLVGCCITACMQKPTLRRADGKPFNVAVLHSFDDKESGYIEYNQELARSFAEEKLDVNLVHYYLNLHAGYSIDYNNVPAIVDSLKANDFDLVITEGVLACYKTISYLNKHNLNSWPIIAGGVSVQVWDSLKVYPNLYVWMDEIDYPRIIRMASTFQKTNRVRIELDHDFLDEKQRIDLKHAISKPPFFNNVDLVSVSAMEIGNPLYLDSIVVTVVSAEEPNSNVAGSKEGRSDTLTLQTMLSFTSDIPTAVVKKDLFSNVLEGATKIPEFTVLPYDFADANRHYLAGYFVPFSTQARDVVQTATEILKGNTNTRIWQGRHIRKGFMDYNCMSSYPDLKYEDYADQYTILNAPFSVAHPYLYNAIWAGVFLFIGLIFTIITHFYLKKKKKIIKTLHERLLDIDTNIVGQNIMVFKYEIGKSAEFNVVTENDEKILSHTIVLGDIPKLYHPESPATFEHFDEMCHTPGFHTDDGLLSFNQGKDYHWWRVRYVTQEIFDKDGSPSFVVTGIIINIDAIYKKKMEIQKAQEKVEEVQRRENFMRTLNHEIRTPLNSVLGFGELITADDFEMTQEEKDEYYITIKHNVNRLNTLVTDILQFSRMESGRMRFEITEFPVLSFMDSVVSEAKAYIEGKLLIDDEGENKSGKFKLEYKPGWGTHQIKADVNHMKQVFRQLISNAVKFSEGGTIHTGWDFDLKTQQVVIYVEDNGIGISDEEQENIFRLFYKGSNLKRGVGLGLSLSSSLIERMGGKMCVRSHVGKGSRFIILMPAM